MSRGVFRKRFHYQSRITQTVFDGIEQGTVVISPGDWPPSAGSTAKPAPLQSLGRQFAAIAASNLGGVLQ